MDICQEILLQNKGGVVYQTQAKTVPYLPPQSGLNYTILGCDIYQPEAQMSITPVTGITSINTGTCGMAGELGGGGGQFISMRVCAGKGLGAVAGHHNWATEMDNNMQISRLNFIDDSVQHEGHLMRNHSSIPGTTACFRSPGVEQKAQQQQSSQQEQKTLKAWPSSSSMLMVNAPYSNVKLELRDSKPTFFVRKDVHKQILGVANRNANMMTCGTIAMDNAGHRMIRMINGACIKMEEYKRPILRVAASQIGQNASISHSRPLQQISKGAKFTLSAARQIQHSISVAQKTSQQHLDTHTVSRRTTVSVAAKKGDDNRMTSCIALGEYKKRYTRAAVSPIGRNAELRCFRPLHLRPVGDNITLPVVGQFQHSVFVAQKTSQQHMVPRRQTIVDTTCPNPMVYRDQASSSRYQTQRNNYVIHKQIVLQNRAAQQMDKKDPNIANMLLFFESGEQRLITFFLPPEPCTVQDLLEELKVPYNDNTTIQCVENPTADIDFAVTVGFSARLPASLIIMRVEQSLEMCRRQDGLQKSGSVDSTETPVRPCLASKRLHFGN